ncbi:flagellin N-terminal helical domain-containing protein [Maritalea porphyrae]|nr:flagellin [Maritalea porphyrae]
MSSIQLSSAVRQNLSSLQATADMMSKTQNILATGLKVNSALDNPSSFFTASSLNQRSSDLRGLLDDMGQSVQTLKAADEGIQAITKLVEAAKGKANQALQSSDTTDRARYATEYNELLGQIEALASDADYKGKNLLAGAGNDLAVIFNELGDSKLNVTAVDYTDISDSGSLGLARQAAPVSGTSASVTISGAELHAATAWADDDALTIQTASGDTLSNSIPLSQGASENGTAMLTANAINSAGIDGLSATWNMGAQSVTITYDHDDIIIDDNDLSGGNLATKTTSNYVAATAGSFATDQLINETLGQLNDALSALRSQASTFGTNLTVVENRQSFTNSLINTLEEGAGKLTLADTNKEGANLLALQTRQQLSSTSLSFASQADQNVLRLF